ncbi:hypothetical protein MKZ38_000078 [Zalerion maritima]|uniref:BHLH domain-containing protein n=1 Tax=Zalerion maritima TaxID=339359 RepID=A0AAD5RTJ9_9PEZI|nr:hypothetical protein MKZ38_000078 [Zalerion maritima]
MTSPRNQRSSSQSSMLAASKPERQKLSEEQKNQNHLNSEHKRRVNIRKGMEDLCDVVPGMTGKAAAEGEVLTTSNTYVREQLEENRRLCDALERKGVKFDPWLKMCDGGTGNAPGSSESPSNGNAEFNGSSNGEQSPSFSASNSSNPPTPQDN